MGWCNWIRRFMTSKLVFFSCFVAVGERYIFLLTFFWVVGSVDVKRGLRINSSVEELVMRREEPGFVVGASWWTRRGGLDVRSRREKNTVGVRVSRRVHRDRLRMISGVMDAKIALGALSSISQVMVAIGLGAVATKKGIITQSTVQELSKVNFNILIPAVTLTSVLRAFSTNASISMGLLPLYALIQILIGLAFGALIAKIFGFESSNDKRIVLASSSFVNGGTIAYFLAGTLFGPNVELASRFIASVSLYLVGWSMLFWTFGASILTYSSSSLSLRDAIFNVQPKKILSPPIIGLGAACAPCSILILAGSLVVNSLDNKAKGGEDGDEVLEDGDEVLEDGDEVLATQSESTPRKGNLTLLSIVFSLASIRFIASPLLTAIFLGWLDKIIIQPLDAMVRLVILMLSTMPPAQNIVLILQLDQNTKAASRAAKVLLILYILSIIPISIFTTLGLVWFNP